MSRNALIVLFPGDLHLTEPGLNNHRTARWMVNEANALIRPDVVQFIGDNVQDATQAQFDLFKELAGSLDVPWFALVGDHDRHADLDARPFLANVGSTFGSLSLKGFRLIRLNTQEGKPAGLSKLQVDWFRDEVDAGLSAGQRVVVFQHNYPYQIWEDFAGPGLDAWREIVQTRRIVAIIAGHTHYWQIANDGRNCAVAVRSIGDPEGGPPGYALAYLQDDDFAITYWSVEEAGPLVLITHPRDYRLVTGPAHVVRGGDVVRARIWSAQPVTGARCRIDRGAWMGLAPLGFQDWVGPLAGDELVKGRHHLEVVAETGDGLRGGNEIDFAVDATGRFTAVPGVWPIVSATAFC